MTFESVVFYDLDSTVADTRHRHHLIGKGDERKNTDWRAYSLACQADAPIEPTIKLLRRLYSSDPRLYFVALSGRHLDSEFLTRDWLIRHQVPFNEIRLRRDGDRRPNEEFKVSVVEEFIAQGKIPFIVIEDFEVVRDAMEKIGVSCLLVQPPPDTCCDPITQRDLLR